MTTACSLTDIPIRQTRLMGLSGWQLFLLMICLSAPIGSLAVISPVPAHDPGQVDIEIQVRVPQSTMAGARLFMAGNVEALRSWRPDGLPLESLSDHLYVVRLKLPAETSVKFKITQGTWATVEKDGKGHEIANRRFVAKRQPDGKPQRISLSVESWANPHVGAKTPESSITGRIEYHREFASKRLRLARTIAVWLPPGYETEGKKLPVLYMQDGQNLFDSATAAFRVEWQADETATRLIADRKIAPFIIVGIGNTSDRIREYTPTSDDRFQTGGLADEYVDFLVEELKPFIDRTYRTRPEREQTAIGGSSLGGLVSLYACSRAPDVFSRCAAISPALGWDKSSLLVEFESTPPEWMRKTRVWVDMGTDEGGNPAQRTINVENVERLAKVVERLGKPAENFRLRVIPDAQHNETAWAARFADIIEFLFPIDDIDISDP